VLLGFLAIGVCFVTLLAVFAHWLMHEFYFGAFSAGVGIIVSVLWLYEFWEELRYRFRVWNRRWRVFRGEI
jgi:hypothetical protein